MLKILIKSKDTTPCQEVFCQAFFQKSGNRVPRVLPDKSQFVYIKSPELLILFCSLASSSKLEKFFWKDSKNILTKRQKQGIICKASHKTAGLLTEKYSRGRRGAPAKGVGRVTGAKVQILSSPPTKNALLSTDKGAFFE